MSQHLTPDQDFWDFLDRLLADHPFMLERPLGSRHPGFPDIIYPLDYGYLKDTTSPDGDAIDAWLGSHSGVGICGVICTVDLHRNDAEMKVLIDCSDAEMALVDDFHNQGLMRGRLIRR